MKVTIVARDDKKFPDVVVEDALEAFVSDGVLTVKQVRGGDVKCWSYPLDVVHAWVEEYA